MRTLKFRIWDDILKVMYTPGMGERIKNLWEIPKLQGGVMKVRNGIKVMQFIGLQDSKGKNIYEGDVIISWLNDVPRTEYRFVCVWKNLGFYFKSLDKGVKSIINSTMLHARETNVEIIGNIHENPELTK